MAQCGHRVRRSCLRIEMLYYTSIALSNVRYVEGISCDGLCCVPVKTGIWFINADLKKALKILLHFYAIHLILLRIARTIKLIHFVSYCFRTIEQRFKSQYVFPFHHFKIISHIMHASLNPEATFKNSVFYLSNYL